MAILNTFKVGDKRYQQVIFSDVDDRVEIQDKSTNEVVLTITSDAYVYDRDGECIGKFRLNHKNEWYYEGSCIVHPEKGWDLIESEVVVAKKYIAGEL